uniref:Uncharacterized protein n=1 Tax=Aegilops tauschii subsp. strangulata TaxID=200361 RepID=A0A453B5L5_AEGTS
ITEINTSAPRKPSIELHSAWFPPRKPRFFSWPCCCSRAPAWPARHGAWRRRRLMTITRPKRRHRSKICCRRSRGCRRSRKSNCRPCPPGSAFPSPSRRPMSRDRRRGP